MTAVKRVHNFNAGPSVLPVPVLEQAQAEMLSYQGSGMSVMELSHRSKEFEAIIKTAEADLRELLSIPANYRVMFLQGGATLQFAMLAMNLRSEGLSADYVVTGSWSRTAYREGAKLGPARLAFNGETQKFTDLPDSQAYDFDPQAAYLHFCHNETIHGVQYKNEPVPPAGVELVCDMSSDFVSQPVDVARYGLIYAGAQKNAGPAGVTLVIAREDLLERVPPGLPLMLDYKNLAESGSLQNTPPCYAVYITGLVFKWLKDLGGLPAIRQLNQRKAGLIYNVIDNSGGFYRGHTWPEARSIMNIPFRLPTEELEAQFVKESQPAGLVGLKGHRSVGGLRASLYNALPHEAAQALADFMVMFQQQNG